MKTIHLFRRLTRVEIPERWLMAVVFLIFAVISVQYSFKILDAREGGLTRSAVLRWLPQIQELENGVNISVEYNYPNPPIMALILWPVTELHPLAAGLVWFYAKVAMALLSLVWCFRMLESSGTRFPFWAKCLTVILSLRPIMSDLSHGNVNILIMFLVIGSLYAFHHRRDYLAGGVLALAIACKLTPALLLPYFVWKGAWKSVAGCFVGLGLFFFLIPGSILGFDYNWALLTGWVDVMVMPFVRGEFVTSEHHNQSLPGVVYRLFTHNPSFSDYDAAGNYMPLVYHNVLNLSTESAKWIVKGCMGLFALLVVCVCRTRSGTDRRAWPMPAEYALIILGMLLFSERTWKHHAVTLVLPFAVLCYTIAATSVPTFVRRFVIGSLIGSTLLIASTSTGLFGVEFAKYAQVCGGFTLAFLTLVMALAVVLGWYTINPDKREAVLETSTNT